MGSLGGWRRLALALGLVLFVAACSGDDDDESSSTTAAPDEDPPAEVVDPYDGHTSTIYDGTTNWLCHPELDDDECRDLSATEVAADGTQRRADLEVATDPDVDCFYVYPTVSQDPGVNSDLEPGDFERLTVGAQAAPYASVCRMFAPVYRQVTLAGLGTTDQIARTTAYNDVVDAWQTYISQYNEGRGVVLIGHSQGASVLRRLIADEIDDDPRLKQRLVSAILLGSTVTVPDGEDVGGSFENVPACTAKDQVGCVISFSSYAVDSPPPATGFFGRADDNGDRALCVDPVALAGGNGLADAIVPVETPLLAGLPTSQVAIETRYIALPEVVEAGCERSGDFDYFSAAKASAEDVRPVDGLVTGGLGPDWGLHLQDANLAMGDLLEVVAAQAGVFGTPAH